MAKERTPEQQAIMDEKDAAAAEAAKALKKLDKAAVAVIAEWMKTHFGKAGYKRLGRQLVATVKDA